VIGSIWSTSLANCRMVKVRPRAGGAIVTTAARCWRAAVRIRSASMIWSRVT